MKELVYKEQLIRVFSPNVVTFYLYDEDGEINEYTAKSVEDAKAKIDNCEIYNADGELVKDF